MSHVNMHVQVRISKFTSGTLSCWSYCRRGSKTCMLTPHNTRYYDLISSPNIVRCYLDNKINDDNMFGIASYVGGHLKYIKILFGKPK
jgi:hypothetical protein